MDWKDFWDKRAHAENPFAQVARVGGNTQQSEVLLDLITTHIAEQLQLGPDDVLLDLCCGNGLLTSRLAGYCKKVVGVDFSPSLIERAKQYHPEVGFICADALALPADLKNEGFTKANLYFSLQYFETFDKGKKVIGNMVSLLKPGSLVLLGDVPDRAKWNEYYNSFGRIFRLAKQMLQNKNDMGKFWSEDELLLICDHLSIKGEKRKQPRELPYSHYRMDFLIET